MLNGGEFHLELVLEAALKVRTQLLKGNSMPNCLDALTRCCGTSDNGAQAGRPSTQFSHEVKVTDARRDHSFFFSTDSWDAC